MNIVPVAASLCVVAACLMPGCTVVHVSDQDGSTRIVRRFGVVAIEPGQASTVMRVTSLGMHSAFGTWSVGFGRAEAATLAPGTCQLVIWAASAETVQSLRELVGTDASLCVINKP